MLDPPRDGARTAPRSKRNTTMSIGTVKWFNATKGYGFIQPDDGSKDVFVHISDVERAGIGHPQEGQKLEYDLQRGNQGKTSATNLKLA
jgi:cold shock protein